MKRTPRRQNGFALLLTLVLLLIAAVALSHVARQSAGEALDALDASESLQRRWAVTSCRATLLPRAQGLLMKAAQGPVDEDGVPLQSGSLEPPGTELRVSCVLAGVSYDLVLTDEQAKYNPTVMGAYRFGEENMISRSDLLFAVRDLAGFRRAAGIEREGAVLLRPLINVDAEGKVAGNDPSESLTSAVYGGYGQLFEGIPAHELLGDANRPGAATNLTCWGDGRLNIQRAPDDVIKRVLAPVLGLEGVGNLLAARDASPGLPPASWLDTLVEVTPERRAIALSMLAEQSQSQGLWVVAHGRTRSWHTFSVRVYTPPSKIEEQPQSPTKKPDLNDPETTDPPPDPVQRYDYAW